MVRIKDVAKLPIKDKPANRLLHVYVTYDKAFAAQGREFPGGYYLHVNPIVEETRSAGMKVTTYSPGSGIWGIILPAERFSQGKLNEVAATIQVNPTYQAMINRTLEKNGIALA